MIQWQAEVARFSRAFHEPPLSRPAATLSPPCGERAGRGVPIWFMVPMHGWKTVGTSLEPSLPPVWEKVPARRLLAVATRWVFLLLLCCAGTSSLRAVQMQPLSIEQLTQKATLVVSGRVLSKSCLRDLAGRIYTRVELQIVEIWKGSLSTNLFPVVQGGGILGDEKATVSGQVEYSVGEEVVVFLVL